MEDKVLAAIITSAVALIIGLINVFVNIRNKKKDDQIVLRQEEFKKELEVIKNENQKKILEFQEELKSKNLDVQSNYNRQMVIFENIQKVKDSIYYFQRAFKRDENKIKQVHIDKLLNSIFGYINIYDSNYANMDDFEKSLIHDFKAVLHNVIFKVESRQMNLEKDPKSNIDLMVSLNNCIQDIGLIQKELKDHYGK